MITVVNAKNKAMWGAKRNEYHFVYIGRGKKPDFCQQGISQLANPFPMTCEAERERVIEHYAQWLSTCCKEYKPQRIALRQLLQICREHEHVALVCWCAPKACHGDLLKRLMDSRLSTEKQTTSSKTPTATV